MNHYVGEYRMTLHLKASAFAHRSAAFFHTRFNWKNDARDPVIDTHMRARARIMQLQGTLINSIFFSLLRCKQDTISHVYYTILMGFRCSLECLRSCYESAMLLNVHCGEHRSTLTGWKHNVEHPEPFGRPRWIFNAELVFIVSVENRRRQTVWGLCKTALARLTSKLAMC